MENNTSPKWVAILSAVFLGWNVGILVAIIIGIVFSVGLNNLGYSMKGASVWVILGLAISTAIVTGVFLGRKTIFWFSCRNLTQAYALLALLIVFTILFFPRPYDFVIQ